MKRDDSDEGNKGEREENAKKGMAKGGRGVMESKGEEEKEGEEREQERWRKMEERDIDR